MSFQPKKFDQIYAEMEQLTQERLPGVTDFRVGSVVRTMYESIAYEMAVLYEQMNQVYLSAYVDTATGTELDRLVAVLGIQRGLPDFAEGVVTFERDPGTVAIVIPIGTLVTTKDSEQSPRKAYKTIESLSFAADQTAIDVKVQAINRSETETVLAEAICIMPQPIPGIKSVLNKAATQFTGKRAETDEELRQRAKSTLLASGKASRTALETALLVLPGVKEVKLIERFESSSEQQSSGLVNALVDGVDFTNQSQVQLLQSQISQAQTAGTTVRMQVCGLIDIFVDGIDFTNQSQVQLLQSQIDQVRAAGVMVRLQSAVPILIDAVFWLEVKSDLSETDRQTLETTVRDAIVQHFIQLKMGEPLLFAQLVRQILSVKGVNNLEKFAIAAYIPSAETLQRQDYQPDDQRIVIEGAAKEAAKFVAQTLQIHCSAEPRALPVAIEFQAVGLTPELQSQIAQQLKNYFDSLEAGMPLEKLAIAEQIASISEIAPDTLKLTAYPWSTLAKVTPNRIEPSIAEKVTFVEPLFAYRQHLSMLGAIRFKAADTMIASEREQIEIAICDRVSTYLDKLQPEQSIDLKDLEKAAQGDHKTLTIEPLIADDFRGESDTVRTVEKEKINVLPFEKAQLSYLCVTNITKPATLNIDSLTLTLRLPTVLLQQYELTEEAQQALNTGTALFTQITGSPRSASSDPAPAPSDESIQSAIALRQTAIQTAVTRALQSFQPNTTLIPYTKLEETILQPLSSAELQVTLAGASYSIQDLRYTLISTDGRRQQSNQTNRLDLHLRSVERPASVTIDTISFTYRSM